MLLMMILVRTGRSSTLPSTAFGLKATNGEKREQSREALPKFLFSLYGEGATKEEKENLIWLRKFQTRRSPNSNSSASFIGRVSTYILQRRSPYLHIM